LRMVWQHLPYFNYHIMDNLKWFKFSPSHWFMGRIQRCSEVSQARFMRLCCIYWTNECVMSIEDAEIELGDDEFKQLLKLRIIEEDNGSLVIKFLDEQYSECIDISKLRSKAAIARWKKAKAKEDNASALQVDASALQDNADKTILDNTRPEETTLDLSEVDLFEKFWTLYSKGVTRIPSQREWSNIDKDEYIKILEHVPKYVKATPKYRKDPVNYLKDRAWLDPELPKQSVSETEKPKERFVPTPPKYT